MEQISHAICSDLLVIATWHSIFDLLRRSAGQRTLLVHDTNKFQVLFRTNCKCCDTRSPPLNPGGHRRRMHHLP
jgi:hypothetical protein